MSRGGLKSWLFAWRADSPHGKPVKTSIYLSRLSSLAVFPVLGDFLAAGGIHPTQPS